MIHLSILKFLFLKTFHLSSILHKIILLLPYLNISELHLWNHFLKIRLLIQSLYLLIFLFHVFIHFSFILYISMYYFILFLLLRHFINYFPNHLYIYLNFLKHMFLFHEIYLLKINHNNILYLYKIMHHNQTFYFLSIHQYNNKNFQYKINQNHFFNNFSIIHNMYHHHKIQMAIYF